MLLASLAANHLFYRKSKANYKGPNLSVPPSLNLRAGDVINDPSRADPQFLEGWANVGT